MRIYACQLDIAWEDPQANYQNVAKLLRDAMCPAGSLVFLPEMFATGFSMNVARTAEDPAAGPTVQFLSRCAKELGIYLAGGFAARSPDSGESRARAQNRLVVMSPDGSQRASYTKIHPFSFGEENRHFSGGESICRFMWSGAIISPFICYDLRFPEVFRLAVQGPEPAQVLAVIANWPQARESHWITLLRARAIENQAYVVGVNRCGLDPKLSYSGRSMIIDPRGEVLADAGSAQGLISAAIDLEALSEWRATFPALQDMRTGVVRRP